MSDTVERTHGTWFHMTKEPRYYAAVDEIREAHAESSFARVASSTTAAERKDIPGLSDKRWKAKEVALSPLGKLPGSVWTLTYDECVDRIVRGWSPSGICVECGEGRRPVVAKEYETLQRYAAPDVALNKIARNHDNNRDDAAKPYGNARESATITGYACACPTTDAPTRPAVVLDPFAGTGTTVMVARALGRYGVGLDLSADYLRLAEWRVFRSGHAAKSTQRTNRENQGQLL